MPLDQTRVTGVLHEECGEVPERYPGYRADLLSVVLDVLTKEREHAKNPLNIRQVVAQRCARAARVLADSREVT